MRKLILMTALSLMSAGVFGNTWTGAGDGLRFSDKDNWQEKTVPVSGWMVLNFANAQANAVISNDLGSIQTYQLKFAAECQSLKLVGDPIGLLSQGSKPGSYAIECLTTAPVEIACDLSVDNAGTHYFKCALTGNLTLSGSIGGSLPIWILAGAGTSDYEYDNKDDHRTTTFTLSGDNTFTGNLTLRSGTYHFGSPTALGAAGRTVSFYTNQKLYFDAAGTYDYTLKFDDDYQMNLFFNADVDLPRGFELAKKTKNSFQIGYANANVHIGHFGTTAFPFTSASFEVADGCKLSIDELKLTDAYYSVTGAAGGETKTGSVTIGSAGSRWQQYQIRYADLICGAENVLCPTGTVSFGTMMNSVYNCAVLNLDGHDQTIDRLSGYGTDYWYVISGSGLLAERIVTPVGKPATLTMKATADCSIQSDFQGPVSLVWDPVGDSTLTINNRTVHLTGDVTVKRGALVLGSTSASATATMPNVRKVVLGETAQLKFAAAQTLPILEVNGTYPAQGRYQPQDGTDATATKVGWLASGSAVVTANTVTSWRTAADGDWSEAAKWTGGVPTTEIDAFVTEPGTDYAVRIATGPATIKTLEVGNRTGVATLAVSNTLTVGKDHAMALNAGARLLLGTGGDWQVKGRVDLNEGASFVAEGGTASFNVKDIAAGASTDALKQNGGTILATNDAQLTFGGYYSSIFSTGLTRFSGSSVLKADPFGASVVRLFTTAADSTTGRVEFVEHASVDAGIADQFVIGYHETSASVDTVSTFKMDTDGTMDFGAWLVVGYAYGRGEFDLLRGTAQTGRSGLTVGGYYMFDRGLKDCDVTGVVRVRDGKLFVDADYTVYPDNRVTGLILGAGWFEKKTVDSANVHRGTLELSGGSVTNVSGNVILGAGCAVGRFVQTGGVFDSVGKSYTDVILGWLGGDGAYILSNGVVRVARTVYVGGLPMMNTSYRLDADHPDGHDATGLLDISGGSFTAGAGVTVGADGHGTIAMGEAGLLDIAGDLILTNGYVEAGSSDLVFRPGAATAGTIRVSGRMTVCADATLTVDVRALGDDFRRVSLVTCDGMQGQFAEGNVHLVGDEETVSKLRLRQRPTGISLIRPVGMSMIVR